VLCAVGFNILSVALHRLHGKDTVFAKALGNDRKGKISLALYLSAVPLTFVNQWIGVAIFVLVALVWLVPDSRFERLIEK
jgi:uncharacterized membrane protein